jgi:uncharacterized membrane protein YeaQ/YmgE (transglycosylase-associated protein family)
MVSVLLVVIAILLILFIVLPLVGVLLWQLIGIAIAGIIIGALARLIVPGRQPIGFVMTILLGIAGAFIGGAIAHAIGLGGFLSFLLEVGTAAVGVAVFSGTHYGRELMNRKDRSLT